MYEIIYVDRSRIREGKFDALRAAMSDLIEFVESNEPQILAYNVYFSEDRSRMTVVHIHSDESSLKLHMRVAGPRFPKFAEFIRMEAIDVYGRLSDELVEQLRAKAETLGSGNVTVHHPYDAVSHVGDA